MISLLGTVETLHDFTKVAYGHAFPYETTTFEDELHKKGFAPLGWFRFVDEDSGESAKLQIGLLRLSLII